MLILSGIKELQKRLFSQNVDIKLVMAKQRFYLSDIKGVMAKKNYFCDSDYKKCWCIFRHMGYSEIGGIQ